MLPFLTELCVQQAMWAKLISEAEIDLPNLEALLNKARPLLATEATLSYTPKKYLKPILVDTLALIGKHQPELKQDLDTLGACADHLLALVLAGDEHGLASWNIVPPILLGQVIDWLLRPEKMALGKLVQPLVNQQGAWETASCPVCGEPADISLVLAEGERHLGCTSCQVSWRYPRLQCSFCNNEDPQTLQYLYLEDNQAQQIQACHQCHNYMKTFDLRDAKEELPDLMQLNLATAHLDVLAQITGGDR